MWSSLSAYADAVNWFEVARGIAITVGALAAGLV